jgi:hypothetical protein
MLDATDAETVGAFVAVPRIHDCRMEAHAGTGDTCYDRTPCIATVARVGERTGVTVTAARSRIKSNHFIPYKTDLTFGGIDLYVFIQHRLTDYTDMNMKRRFTRIYAD